jgi:hypothetical protein
MGELLLAATPAHRGVAEIVVPAPRPFNPFVGESGASAGYGLTASAPLAHKGSVGAY